jgi:hypothetical protein
MAYQCIVNLKAEKWSYWENASSNSKSHCHFLNDLPMYCISKLNRHFKWQRVIWKMPVIILTEFFTITYINLYLRIENFKPQDAFLFATCHYKNASNRKCHWHFQNDFPANRISWVVKCHFKNATNSTVTKVAGVTPVTLNYNSN